MKIKVRGNKNLQGTVKISGAKNSAVACIPAIVLCDEEVILRNIPDIDDVRTLMAILSQVGFDIEFENNTLRAKKMKEPSYIITSPEVSKLRGSYYFMGAYLGRYQKINITHSGGCNLGIRPINFHMEGFQKMNVDVSYDKDCICLNTKELKGTQITLDYPSVGATINLMLAAVLAHGTTTIYNAAIEPEIGDVARFLCSMGANISGLDTPTLIIHGVEKLHKTDYTIISDRIEAGTYLVLGALCTGEGIRVDNINPLHLTEVIKVFQEIGCNLVVEEHAILIKNTKPLSPFSIEVKPYPLFPTDLGQMMNVLMTQIEGTSTLIETIFTNRFSHVHELKKMGANIEVIDKTIKVVGPMNLHPAEVMAHDLRGAAAVVLAAIIQNEASIIDNVEVLFRGYENIIGKMHGLGGNIELIT